ncbi:MAG: ABC transporter ATP-binding protein [Clostridiales Family XIII bacterium]|jgi:putative ABC transport system ATP-binding protein|nr:ABC transporter ATP-binding protein [Clostridiales Family XIII bacterium]
MILEAREIRKEYKRGGTLLQAVDDVSLELTEGEFVCLVGRSGSGKSTLLNILAGLLSPTSGSVSFEGRNYTEMDDEALSLLRNTRLGYIMQGHSVLPNFTVLQNVILPHVLFKRGGEPAERAAELLEDVGIRHLSSQYPHELSGGELRRVAIARALLSAPSLLIADEPTGDLDDETTADIMDLFAGLAEKGTAVLMVTHDTEAASRSHRILTMKAGRIVKAGL